MRRTAALLLLALLACATLADAATRLQSAGIADVASEIEAAGDGRGLKTRSFGQFSGIKGVWRGYRLHDGWWWRNNNRYYYYGGFFYYYPKCGYKGYWYPYGKLCYRGKGKGK